MTSSIYTGGSGRRQSSERARVAANGAVVRRFLTGAFSDGDEAAFTDALAPDHVQHGPAPYQTFTGVEETRRYAERLARAFPDLTVVVTDVLSAGDMVRANARMRGHHTGDLALGDSTFGPTGREASWRTTFQCRIEDGKIAETWVGMDRTDLVRQLGVTRVVAPPARATA